MDEQSEAARRSMSELGLSPAKAQDMLADVLTWLRRQPSVDQRAGESGFLEECAGNAALERAQSAFDLYESVADVVSSSDLGDSTQTQPGSTLAPNAEPARTGSDASVATLSSYLVRLASLSNQGNLGRVSSIDSLFGDQANAISTENASATRATRSRPLTRANAMPLHEEAAPPLSEVLGDKQNERLIKLLGSSRTESLFRELLPRNLSALSISQQLAPPGPESSLQNLAHVAKDKSPERTRPPARNAKPRTRSAAADAPALSLRADDASAAAVAPQQKAKRGKLNRSSANVSPDPAAGNASFQVRLDKPESGQQVAAPTRIRILRSNSSRPNPPAAQSAQAAETSLPAVSRSKRRRGALADTAPANAGAPGSEPRPSEPNESVPTKRRKKVSGTSWVKGDAGCGSAEAYLNLHHFVNSQLAVSSRVRNFKVLGRQLSQLQASTGIDLPTGWQNTKHKVKAAYGERRSRCQTSSWKELVALVKEGPANLPLRERAKAQAESVRTKLAAWLGLPAREENPQLDDLTEAMLSCICDDETAPKSILLLPDAARELLLTLLMAEHEKHGQRFAKIHQRFRNLYSRGEVEAVLLATCICSSCKTAWNLDKRVKALDEAICSRDLDAVERMRCHWNREKAGLFRDLMLLHFAFSSAADWRRAALRQIPKCEGWEASDFVDAASKMHNTRTCAHCKACDISNQNRLDEPPSAVDSESEAGAANQDEHLVRLRAAHMQKQEGLGAPTVAAGAAPLDQVRE